MPNQDSNKEITALAIRSAQEFSTRSSLVSRGLREIASGLQSEYDTSVMDRAMASLHEDKFEEAISICTRGLEVNVNDEVLLQIKAVSLAKQGKYAEGFPFLTRALEINDTNPHCWYLAARFLQQLNKPEEELGCLQRVVSLKSDLKGAWREQGDCLFTLGRYQEAVQAFESELKLNPSDEYCQAARRDVAIATALGEKGEWTPTSILHLLGWYSEKFDGRQLAPYTEMRNLNLFCEIRNISGHECRIGKRMSMYRRSKETGRMQRFAEALILEDKTFKLPLMIAPHSEVDPISVEVIWTCSLDKTDPDCVEELFDITRETVARDDEFGTVIKLVE
jgi:tetratricopeptide (TPR) repeat protein